MATGRGKWIRTAASREKQRQAQLGKGLGRKHSEESIQKMCGPRISKCWINSSYCKFNGQPKLKAEVRDELTAAQKGLCALCGQPETKSNQHGNCGLSIDHDHETGEVRALLCNRCNVGLGWFAEDTKILQKAIDYLRRYGG